MQILKYHSKEIQTGQDFFFIMFFTRMCNVLGQKGTMLFSQNTTINYQNKQMDTIVITFWHILHVSTRVLFSLTCSQLKSR